MKAMKLKPRQLLTQSEQRRLVETHLRRGRPVIDCLWGYILAAAFMFTTSGCDQTNSGGKSSEAKPVPEIARAATPPETVVLPAGTLLRLRTSDPDLAVNIAAWVPLAAGMLELPDPFAGQIPVLADGEYLQLVLSDEAGLEGIVQRGRAPLLEVIASPAEFAPLIEAFQPFINLAVYDDRAIQLGPADRMRLINLICRVPTELRSVSLTIRHESSSRFTAELFIDTRPDTWLRQVIDCIQPGPRHVRSFAKIEELPAQAVSIDLDAARRVKPLLQSAGVLQWLKALSGGDADPMLLLDNMAARLDGTAVGFIDVNSGGQLWIGLNGAQQGTQPNNQPLDLLSRLLLSRGDRLEICNESSADPTSDPVSNATGRTSNPLKGTNEKLLCLNYLLGHIARDSNPPPSYRALASSKPADWVLNDNVIWAFDRCPLDADNLPDLFKQKGLKADHATIRLLKQPGGLRLTAEILGK